MTDDLHKLSNSFRDSAARLSECDLVILHINDTGVPELNRALRTITDDVLTFQMKLSARFDQHASNLENVTQVYHDVEINMRELFEDLRDNYGDQ
jgi:hypothetical protein